MGKYTRGSIACLVMMVTALLGGCAGPIKNMQEMAPGAPDPSPKPGKAMVVFMRPATLGFAVQSSVFEIRGGAHSELVGIVAAKTKVAYHAEPGPSVFMALGESAEFIDAELVAGRTYYAYVAPRMGMWKARFVLEPKSRQDLESGSFKTDLQDCRWVEVAPESRQWMRENLPSIESKRAAHFREWQDKPVAERMRLRPDDGR